jgi:hypothetical protein
LPRLILILALAVGLSACASTASDPAAGGVDPDASAAADKPKQRCYREKETGSRLGRRVCVTVDE